MEGCILYCVSSMSLVMRGLGLGWLLGLSLLLSVKSRSNKDWSKSMHDQGVLVYGWAELDLVAHQNGLLAPLD